MIVCHLASGVNFCGFIFFFCGNLFLWILEISAKFRATLLNTLWIINLSVGKVYCFPYMLISEVFLH